MDTTDQLPLVQYISVDATPSRYATLTFEHPLTSGEALAADCVVDSDDIVGAIAEGDRRLVVYFTDNAHWNTDVIRVFAQLIQKHEGWTAIFVYRHTQPEP